MKFSCSKSELLSAVAIASKAASAKSPIPALEGILVEAGMGNVKFTGYDLKKGIYTSIQADVPEVGSIVLGARIFENIVRSLPDGVVTVKTGGNNKTRDWQFYLLLAATIFLAIPHIALAFWFQGFVTPIITICDGLGVLLLATILLNTYKKK